MKSKSLTSLFAVLTLSIQSAFCAGPSHVPEPGDVVVTYKSEFKPEHFKEGLKALEASLKRLVFEHPAVRDVYVMKDVKTHTVLGVVLWDSRKEHKAWKNAKNRERVGDSLKEFLVKPAEIQEYELILVDDE